MEVLLKSVSLETSKWSEIIIENISDGIIVLDGSYIIRLFNKQAERIFGYLAYEVLGKTLNVILPNLFLEASRSNIANFPIVPAILWGKSERKEIYGKRKDGLELILEASLSKCYSDGELLSIISFQDITEKKLSQNKLGKSKANIEEQIENINEYLAKLSLSLQQETFEQNLFEAINNKLFTAIEHTSESIVIFDKKGTIDYVNPSFERITGYESKEVCCHRIKGLIGPNSIKEYKKILETLFKDEKWQGTYWAKKKDGSLYEEETTILPVKSSQGETISYVAIGRDVTEKKRFESIIDSVDMMKNVGYIFAGIRHELGNPINSIKTSLSVLKKGLDSCSQDSILVYIERALSEITRVEYLLKALKSFSMYENLKLEKINLAPIMEKFCSLAKEDSEKKGIKLGLHCSTKEISALIDQRAFHQVMLNIFSNAVDALEGRSNPTIDIFLYIDDKFAKVEVIDNGVGISDSQKEKLFKPFNTFKPQGTGLGLVITKKLITNMQGTLEIDSIYNSGTRATIVLDKLV